MANPTSNFNWQMPTPTDLVTDLPADFEVFGQAVDSSMADLLGGTTGQVLSKNSNTDMDFTWIAASTTPTYLGVSVYKSGDQTISNATDTAITFDSEFFDTDALHSTSTNTSRLTVPTGKGGKYLICGTVGFAPNATGSRGIRVYKNGSVISYATVLQTVTVASNGSFVPFSIVTQLSAADYIEIFAYQSSGISLSVTGTSSQTSVQMSYLGA
jgi:hypothetical protein